MKIICVSLICVVFLVAASANVCCAETIAGTLLSFDRAAGLLTLSINGAMRVVKAEAGTKVMRGQVGKELRQVALSELARGDRIVVVVGRDSIATSVKAYFGIVKGVLASSRGDKLTLKDGRAMYLHPEAEVMLDNGKQGKASELKPGSLVICRVDPSTGLVWMALATVPVKSKIDSVTYSGASPLKSGDLLTVDVSGTPGATVSFDVKGLIPSTVMKETSPGFYRAVVEVPKDKTVRNAPLVARLSVGGTEAPLVQASRLVTVAATANFTSAPSKPAPAASSVPAPAPPPPAQVKSKAPESTPPPARISISAPVDGSKIRKALLIKGTAEPDFKVQVTITYTNGLAGVLKLAGEITSQLVAVGKNGEFKVGPIALEGPLATKGLQFTVKAYYPDQADHATVIVRVVGARE